VGLWLVWVGGVVVGVGVIVVVGVVVVVVVVVVVQGVLQNKILMRKTTSTR